MAEEDSAGPEGDLSAPPDPSQYQTEGQRRRNLPLSQLKRKKKTKVPEFDPDLGGEFLPLVQKTDMRSRLLGEDYWIDIAEYNKQAKKEAKRKRAPSKDQFKADKLKNEMVNPYKQNWLLIICLAISVLVGVVSLNPGMLNEFPKIQYPDEL